MGFLKNLAKNVAGPLVGGIAGYAGAKEAASASKEAAREQMAFQERMSNTAYQRASKDLEKAGLNRIIAMGNPASSPVGAMATIPDFGGAITSGMSAGAATQTSALQTARFDEDMAKLVAETKTLNTKLGRELMQTRLWKRFGKLILASEGNFSKLLEFTQEPSTWQKVTEDLQSLEDRLKNYFGDVLKEIYGNRVDIDFLMGEKLIRLEPWSE